MAARQKGSVEAGFVPSASGSGLLLSTVALPSLGCRGGSGCCCPREDEVGEGQSQKGERRLARGCVLETESEAGRMVCFHRGHEATSLPV